MVDDLKPGDVVQLIAEAAVRARRPGRHGVVIGAGATPYKIRVVWKGLKTYQTIHCTLLWRVETSK